MAQQPILSPTWSQLQHSLQLLHHLADPLGDLKAHIGHLHNSLPLHHHLNDDHQFQIALLVSSVSIELAYHHQPESYRQSFKKGLGGREWQTPRPIDRTPETPGSGKNKIPETFLQMNISRIHFSNMLCAKIWIQGMSRQGPRKTGKNCYVVLHTIENTSIIQNIAMYPLVNTITGVSLLVTNLGADAEMDIFLRND